METDRLPAILRKLLSMRRAIRVRHALSRVETKSGLKVIDIGCGVDGRSFEDFVPNDWTIIGVDIEPEGSIRHTHGAFSYVRQDASNLSRFGNEEFDLAVSIGMLEHITEPNKFNSVVHEIHRVAVQHIVIVPFRYCWIEPHYGLPFFPIMPSGMQNLIVKTFNLSGHKQLVQRDPGYIRKNYRWLSNGEYRQAFPTSRISLSPTLETITITRGVGL